MAHRPPSPEELLAEAELEAAVRANDAERVRAAIDARDGSIVFACCGPRGRWVHALYLACSLSHTGYDVVEALLEADGIYLTEEDTELNHLLHRYNDDVWLGFIAAANGLVASEIATFVGNTAAFRALLDAGMDLWAASYDHLGLALLCGRREIEAVIVEEEFRSSIRRGITRAEVYRRLILEDERECSNLVDLAALAGRLETLMFLVDEIGLEPTLASGDPDALLTAPDQRDCAAFLRQRSGRGVTPRDLVRRELGL